jgi:beclin
MSFILLSDSTVTGPASHKETPAPSKAAAAPVSRDGAQEQEVSGGVDDMEKINKLFEILTARSDVDHPVCVECTDTLITGLQKRLEEVAKEREALVGYIKVAEANAPTEEELEAQEAAVRDAKKLEADTLAELSELEREKASLDDEILALEEESRTIDIDEQRFWGERNAFATTLAAFQNERDSINSKYDYDSRLLERLQRSNVYNDTFCISHDGTFATINGLRLGRLSNRPVDWPEVNAAWGHALLLLVTVAERLSYRFEGLEPQPMGSTSRIVRYDVPSPSNSRHAGGAPPAPPKRHALELFSSGDMPRMMPFVHRKFDQAMVAFLELVRQLGAFVQREPGNKHLQLPYRIEGDKIGDVSIKLSSGQDEDWTKACKLTLTCCKFLLAHASNVNSEAKREGASS